MTTPESIYRPGLEGVVAGETAISTVASGLLYRGYDIKELAEHGTFEEVAYLLLHGELPKKDELQAFHKRICQATVDPLIVSWLHKLPTDSNPMDVMRSGASVLAHWDPESQQNDRAANLRKAERLLAQLPVILAAWGRLRQNMEPVPAEPDRGLAANLLWMLFRTEPTEQAIKAMDVSLILYAEHELNASTFAARVIASTLADLHSAVTGAIGALKGPLHGGANERVMEVLEEVGSPDGAEAWIRDALARKQRIMGFGHRVYKDGDVRARYLKTLCGELAKSTGNEPLEQMAEVIEGIVWQEKKLPPNLDWPSARLYHYLGLPIELYTPLFVVSRVSGWAAHVIEQLDNNRLIRPRANYTGPAPRAWVGIEGRKPRS